MSMSHSMMFALFSVILSMAAPSPALAFGPGEAAGSPRPGPTRADFIVLIWYRRDDPLGTFQHQTYDVRKGQYTRDVDDWVRDARANHPSYTVRVRPVDLSRERGETEKLRVGSVIYRDLLSVAAGSGVMLEAPVNIGAGPYAGQGQTSRSYQMPTPGRDVLDPGPNNLNIPVYPRTRTP
jgi:hypothetical protein